MPDKKQPFYKTRLGIVTIIAVIVIIGFIFPPDNPITIQIFDAVASPIITFFAEDIGEDAVNCIEELSGTYNFQTLECELP